jgi:hypothetical protein
VDFDEGYLGEISCTPLNFSDEKRLIFSAISIFSLTVLTAVEVCNALAKFLTSPGLEKNDFAHSFFPFDFSSENHDSPSSSTCKHLLQGHLHVISWQSR